MKPTRNDWPAGEKAGTVKFIAQSMREMLANGAFASFRVTTLDIQTRIRELITLCGDVKQERIPLVSLEPCIEELQRSFDTDRVINQIAHDEIVLYKSLSMRSNLSEKNLDLYRRFLISVHNKISDKYKIAIQEMLISSLDTTKEKEKLRSLVNSYCSSVINSGYSREFVLQQVEERFFKHNIKKIEKRTLSRFFSKFDNVKRKYVVVVPIMPPVASYLEKVFTGSKSIIKNLNELSSDAEVALSGHPDHDECHKFSVWSVEALDPFVAMRNIDQTISTMAAMTYLGRRGIELEWRRHGYVKTVRAAAGAIVTNDQVSLQKLSSRLSRRLVNELVAPAQKILSEFSDESTERLFSAVNMSALARISERSENQLIALWSAIEVLLSDPPRGVPRVTHYVDMFTPCVCIKYVRQYIVAVYDELRVHYSKHLKSFFQSEGFDKNVDQYTNFSYLLFLPEHKNLHHKFCAPMLDNPLALYRLWKLEKNFSNPASYLESVNNHFQRVEWQLHRIYRTRNVIVHSGKIPPFLAPLSLNVFEYFRGAVGPIMGRASKSFGKSAIDQLVAEIKFDFQKRLSSVRAMGKAKDFTADDIMIFHR